jgi:hypothetical protein
MKTSTTLAHVGVCCIAALCLLGSAFGDTPDPGEAPGDVHRKVVGQAVAAEAPEREQTPAELGERVGALEKENLVLREDLGKARLDARARLEEAERERAELESRLQQRVDELNERLAAERDRQARKSRNLWLAVGILALAIIGSD